jgi:uncharacterized protein (DUF885 family)
LREESARQRELYLRAAERDILAVDAANGGGGGDKSGSKKQKSDKSTKTKKSVKQQLADSKLLDANAPRTADVDALRKELGQSPRVNNNNTDGTGAGETAGAVGAQTLEQLVRRIDGAADAAMEGKDYQALKTWTARPPSGKPAASRAQPRANNSG